MGSVSGVNDGLESLEEALWHLRSAIRDQRPWARLRRPLLGQQARDGQLGALDAHLQPDAALAARLPDGDT